MSLATWKAQYYPVPAQDCPKEQALEHSRRKWIGLRKENLEKHGLCYGQHIGAIYAEGNASKLDIDGHTCALCAVYGPTDEDCGGCPLFLARGVRCDESHGNDAAQLSPFHAFVDGDKADPEPMIALIERAIENERSKNESGNVEA